MLINADLIEAARGVDLISLVERDLGQSGRRSGKWVLFNCPFHDDENPSFGVSNGDGAHSPYFECFACGKKGDSIDWLVEFRGLDFKQAVQELGGVPGITWADAGQARRREADPAYKEPPGEVWQARAKKICERANNLLLSELGYFKEINWPMPDKNGNLVYKKMPAMDYLHNRGLTEETIRNWKIGFIPEDKEDECQFWGLPGNKLMLYQGILIPTIIDSKFWRLKIRRPRIEKNERYRQIKGGEDSAPYMLPTLEWNDTVVLTEGEFDALLLWQECEHLTGVMTLGSASADFDITNWGLYLVGTKRRLICYDMDEAGEKGSSKLEWLGNSRRIQVPKINPHDKDITDYWRAGGDVRAWLLEELRRG